MKTKCSWGYIVVRGSVLRRKDLTPTAKLLHGYLSGYCLKTIINNEFWFGFIDKIANELGEDRRSIERAINLLERKELLQRTHRLKRNGFWVDGGVADVQYESIYKLQNKNKPKPKQIHEEPDSQGFANEN